MTDHPLDRLKSAQLTYVAQSQKAVIENRSLCPGQIRLVRFELPNSDFDQRFVLIVRTDATNSQIVQAMLIGEDDALAGKNDVILRADESPTLDARVVQTGLLFPLLVEDCRSVFSEVHDDTIELIHQMRNFSGRSPRRAGPHRHDDFGPRADHIRNEIAVVQLISASALSVMASPQYVTRRLEELGVLSHGLSNRKVEMTLDRENSARILNIAARSSRKKETQRMFEQLAQRKAG